MILIVLLSLLASAWCLHLAATRERLVALVVFFLAAGSCLGALLSMLTGTLAGMPDWMRFGAGVALVLGVIDLGAGEPLDPELHDLMDDARRR